MKYSRRNQMQDVAASAEADCVAGIVAALEARHAIELFRQDIDNFALTLVAPLQAHYCYILFHITSVGHTVRIFRYRIGSLLTTGRSPRPLEGRFSAQMLVDRLGDHILTDGADDLLF